MRKLKYLAINYFRAFWSWHRSKKECRYLPVYIMVEPTNNCNLTCLMCESSIMRRKKGFMDIELFKKIIRENHKFIPKIEMFYHGEPLLAPNLCEMVKYAADFGIPSIIETNATLLNEKLIFSLIESGLEEISFSFDGYSKQHYESIRQGARYEAVLRNIKEFLEIRKRLNKRLPFVYLQIINVGFDKTQIKKCFRKFQNYGFDRIDIIPLHRWEGMKLEEQSSFKRFQFKGKCYRCFMPWVVMGILWDGQVVACSDDFDGGRVIGNVTRQKLADIWNGEKILALRSMIAERKNIEEMPCKNCFRPWLNPLKFPMFEYVRREFSRAFRVSRF